MTVKTLPGRLGKEPLIDAVCEIRFSSEMAVSDVLPGLLIANWSNKVSNIERLPISDIPAQIRDADLNLRYQPVLRVSWGDFFILVGNRTLAIACKLPYPGWSALKAAVMELISHAARWNLFHEIERYSMKYVDLIEGSDLREMIRQANVDLRVGSHQLAAESFLVRIEIPEEPHLHMIQITAPATTTFMDGTQKTGMIVDIDSICAQNTGDIGSFVSTLPGRLDDTHAANKRIFFSCLTEQAIDDLEPIYDRV